jgi:hypothetical protein
MACFGMLFGLIITPCEKEMRYAIKMFIVPHAFDRNANVFDIEYGGSGLELEKRIGI